VLPNPSDGVIVHDLPPRRGRSPHAAARRRYRLAQWLSVALGLAAAGCVISVSAAHDGLPAAALDPRFILQAIVLLVLAGSLPWLLAELLWRRARRRNFWEWQ
jgi:hypothetical protein